MVELDLEPLVEKAQKGDAAALERLLVACEPAMQRLARRYCPAGEAEDAVQEILLRASEEIGALRVAKSFVSWSLRMLVRECFRFHRRAVRWVLRDDEEPVSASAVELRLELVRGLAQLSDHSRSILVEHELLGHTKEESAERLGISLESAKSRLRRARSELREALSA
jgi:RNA polymerase sigma factor (sigma-70 family)